MEGAAVFQTGVHGGAVGGIFKEAPVLNGAGNPGQVLIHHPAAADIGVAHLAVAHLPVGQAHIQPGGGEGGMSALGKKAVQHRRPGVDDGIAVRVIPKAEAVHNNQSSRCFVHNDLKFLDLPEEPAEALPSRAGETVPAQPDGYRAALWLRACIRRRRTPSGRVPFLPAARKNRQVFLRFLCLAGRKNPSNGPHPPPVNTGLIPGWPR